jgi:protein tyrosine/serine phosphatase
LVASLIVLPLFQSVSAAEPPDLPNFHVVHDFLLRGGEPSEHGLETLKGMGVKTIIDLRAPTEMAIAEGKTAKRLGITYINLPMTSAAPTAKQVTTFEQAIETVQAESAKSPHKAGPNDPSVFVHCAHGSDRTGCMVGIWRVRHDHFTYPEAYKEMRQYYFGPKYTALAKAVEERAKH